MKKRLSFGLFIAVFLIASGCEPRNLAPEANYDQERVEKIRDTIDSTLEE